MHFHTILELAAATVAGAVNAVAGGGTLLTFPALLASGQLKTVANATSAVALWPGSVSSALAYRKELKSERHLLLPLILLGLAGGLVGSILLLITPTRVFDQVIPFLVLTATLLFICQEPMSRWMKARAAASGAVETETKIRLTPPMVLMVFATAVYGGYFGAGIGIVTLAALSLMGMRDIHQMNGIKCIYALFTNGIASVVFISKGLVDWKVALLMAVGAVFGGYFGAGFARKIGQKNVRIMVITIGLVLTVSLFRK